MSRPLLLLLLAATFATVAAVGAGGLEQLSAAADDDRSAQGADPAPTPLEVGDATAGLSPRVVVPQRDLHMAAGLPADELLAADGTSRDRVDRGGSTVRFSVEVEAVTGLDPDTVAAEVEDALYDERSWARDHDLRRVAPEDARLHVVVASPDRVDAMCRRAGLDTAGWLSCWSRDTAAINVERWTDGVEHFDDLAQYRRYVINHEVGHGLGYGHRGCPGNGRVAPLMQQQSKSLRGCLANEWRHPDD